MKHLKYLCALILATIFIGCENNNDEEANITVTPPAIYSLERDGQTTVIYSGQSTRLEMAGELSVWLNTEFEGGRHQDRIDKIDYIKKG